jgi:hypothetical protein
MAPLGGSIGRLGAQRRASPGSVEPACPEPEWRARARPRTRAVATHKRAMRDPPAGLLDLPPVARAGTEHLQPPRPPGAPRRPRHAHTRDPQPPAWMVPPSSPFGGRAFGHGGSPGKPAGSRPPPPAALRDQPRRASAAPRPSRPRAAAPGAAGPALRESAPRARAHAPRTRRALGASALPGPRPSADRARLPDQRAPQRAPRPRMHRPSAPQDEGHDPEQAPAGQEDGRRGARLIGRPRERLVRPRLDRRVQRAHRQAGAPPPMPPPPPLLLLLLPLARPGCGAGAGRRRHRRGRLSITAAASAGASCHQTHPPWHPWRAPARRSRRRPRRALA